MTITDPSRMLPHHQGCAVYRSTLYWPPRYFGWARITYAWSDGIVSSMIVYDEFGKVMES